MVYVDTCVLVAALTNEEWQSRAAAWLEEHHREGLAYTEWVSTEFSAATSIKVRQRSIDGQTQRAIMATYREMTASLFELIEITGAHFRAATDMTELSSTGIRAGDALHLAVCRSRHISICTIDRLLGKAGPQLGVQTVLL